MSLLWVMAGKDDPQLTGQTFKVDEGWAPPVHRVPLTRLVVSHDAMTEVLRSGRKSLTPDHPVRLEPRDDMPGHFEVADGHHRVADALRAGERHVDAVIDHDPPVEPHQPPFYDFTQHVSH